MNYKVLFNFISPLTGRILCDKNTVLVGDENGVAIPSASIPIEILPIAVKEASFVINTKPVDTTLQFVNAQYLSDLGDGGMIKFDNTLKLLKIATPDTDYATKATLVALAAEAQKSADSASSSAVIAVEAAGEATTFTALAKGYAEAAGVSATEAAASAVLATGFADAANTYAGESADYRDTSIAASKVAGERRDEAAASATSAATSLNILLTTGLNALPNSGNVNFQGWRGINGADGIDPTDFATLQQVTAISGTYIKTVTGTADQIVVTAGQTPVVSMASTYIGQTSITTLGTVTTGAWNGSVIPLANGGTNANLTASNGGILYSTSTAVAVLAGTATANQLLISGASSTPSWTSRFADYGTTDSAKLGNLFTGTGCGSTTIVTALKNTGYGIESLKSITTTSGGNNNSAFGYRALYNLSTGNNNIAFGAESLFSNIEGAANVASGYQSLYFNTHGSGNVASGFQSLYSNTTGEFNTAIGYNSLYSNTTGIDNVAIGYQSLFSSETSNNCVAIGFQCLRANTTGYSNVGLGYQSLYSNTTGYYNIATGGLSLYSNTTGYSNVASGRQALYSNIDGSENSAFGQSSGDSRNKYTQCTFLGANTDASVNNLTNATSVGYGATVDESNCMTLGNSSLTKIKTTAAWNGATISLAYGGTNASLTASNGGILYSTASAVAILAGTATANQLLVSGTSGAPSWKSRILDYGISTPANEGNLFVGTECGKTGMDGAIDNTGFGVRCFANISLSDGAVANTSFGSKASYNLFTGIGNTSIGDNSLYSNTTKNFNTAGGHLSLYNLTGGSGENAAWGSRSGYLRASYTQCTFLGSESDASVTGLVNATSVGYGATVDESNCIKLGNASLTKIKTTGSVILNTDKIHLDAANGRIGVGIANPTTAKLVVSGGVVTSSEESCMRATGSSVATKIEIQNTAASGRLWELRSLNNGYFDIVDRTAPAGRFSIDTAGRVGIGGITADQLLTVNSSTPSKITAGSWVALSDKRIKDVLGTYDRGLSDIIQIEPKRYNFNDKSGYPIKEQQKTHIGVIAQEIEEIFPECIVDKVQKGDIDDMRVYDSTALTYALINAVKELNQKIEKLESQLGKNFHKYNEI